MLVVEKKAVCLPKKQREEVKIVVGYESID